MSINQIATKHARFFKASEWRASWKEFLTSQAEMISPIKLKELLTKLVLMRVVILSVLLGTSAWSLFSHAGAKESNHSLVFWMIGGTYAISLINLLLIRKEERLLRLGYLQLLTDVALASVAIHISGGPASPFVVLYLVIIVGAAVVLSREGAVIVAAASGLCYAVIASDILPRVGIHSVPASAQNILGVYLSLVVIALVSGYLAKQLETLWGVNNQQARDLSELSNQQRQLFEDLSEGVIVVQLNGEISSINHAGCAVLGIDSSQAPQLQGKNLPELLSARGIVDAKKILERSSDRETSREISIPGGVGEGELCLRYKVRPMTNALGAECGRIIVFSDVSHVRTMEKRLSLHEEMTKLLAQEEPKTDGHGHAAARTLMVGESGVMKQVFSLVERIANSEATVLITGESGAGKELIAKAIHQGSKRSAKPFVAINCGAIPENLIESELFGHRKGSFTGATGDKPGLFRQANGGTIFLDEIGELHPLMQTKLLRVLQEKCFRPVGDVVDYPVDVRVISATNRDLKKELQTGGFREDLYYRLNVVNVTVPPLRDRKEDIPLLVRYFIGRFADPSRVLPQISPEALQLLSSYDYPGNIRELENIVERALVLGGQAILAEHLPDDVRDPISRLRGSDGHGVQSGGESQTDIIVLPIDLESELAKLETRYLQQALEASGGVKKQAADLLGLNFRSLRYRLKKYGMAGETSFE